MSQQILSLIVASKTVTFYLFITQAWEKGTYFCLLVGSGSFFICQEYTKTSFCFVLSRCMFFLLLVAWESSRHFTGVSAKWRLRNDSRSSVLMTYHYPDLGSASDWLKQNSFAARPIRSTTMIWYWHVISMEIQRSFLRHHFTGIRWWHRKMSAVSSGFFSSLFRWSEFSFWVNLS